jgi:hypothetical protein
MTASYNTIIVVGGSAGTHSILIAEPVSSVASRSIGSWRAEAREGPPRFC